MNNMTEHNWTLLNNKKQKYEWIVKDYLHNYYKCTNCGLIFNIKEWVNRNIQQICNNNYEYCWFFNEKFEFISHEVIGCNQYLIEKIIL